SAVLPETANRAGGLRGASVDRVDPGQPLAVLLDQVGGAQTPVQFAGFRGIDPREPAGLAVVVVAPGFPAADGTVVPAPLAGQRPVPFHAQHPRRPPAALAGGASPAAPRPRAPHLGRGRRTSPPGAAPAAG